MIELGEKMDLGTLKLGATQAFGRGLLLGKKYSPEILTAVGVVGVIAGTVMVARATLKLEPVIDKMQDRLRTINELREATESLTHSATTQEVEPYTREESVRDKTAVYVRGAYDITKLYGPGATLILVSLGCFLAAHGIMRSRNAALVAAYNVLEKSFSAYRKRFIEEFGPEKDEEYRSGTYTVEETDFETGEKTLRKVVDPNAYSQYAKFFDEGNVHWQNVNDYNLVFLRAQQQFANDLLIARGHVFLNDVYDSIGIERTSAGAVVGWVLNKKGDNFVDFGMYNEDSERARAFINGDEKSIFLDFNVDGVIYDLI